MGSMGAHPRRDGWGWRTVELFRVGREKIRGQDVKKKKKNYLKGAPKGDGEGRGEGGNGKRSALVILSLLIGLQLHGFWPS